LTCVNQRGFPSAHTRGIQNLPLFLIVEKFWSLARLLILKLCRAKDLIRKNLMPWSVYIIQCSDSKLYTGITNNLERRVKDHNSGNGCRFTKYRTPVTLLHTEQMRSRPEALKREARIKHLTRKEKKTSYLFPSSPKNCGRFFEKDIR